jgi:hypothetical protein
MMIVDLLIGCPFEMLFHKKPTHGSLNEEFGKTASAAHPNNDPFEEVKFVTPFVPSSPSLELEQCPPGHPNDILNSGLHSTDVFLRNRNFYAIDMLLSTPCPYEDPTIS